MARIIFSFKKSFLEREGLTKEGMEKCLAILSTEFRKAQDQHDFEYFKRRALACLRKQYKELEEKEKEEKEEKKVSKAFILAETELEKAFPVGTIRTWKGKKFIKSPDKKWRPYYENHKMRGEKLALAALAKKINSLKDGDYEGLYKLITLQRSRFTSDGSLIKDLYNAMKVRGALGNGRFTKKEEPKEEKKKPKLRAIWKSDIFSEDEQQAMKDLDKLIKSKEGELRIKNEKYNKKYRVLLGEHYDKDGNNGFGISCAVDNLFRWNRPPYDVYCAGALLEMVFEMVRNGDINDKTDIEIWNDKSIFEKNSTDVYGCYITNKKSSKLRDMTHKMQKSKDQGTLLFLDNVKKFLDDAEKVFFEKKKKEEKKAFEENRKKYMDVRNKKIDEKDESNNYKIKRDFESELSKSLVGKGVKESPEEIMNGIYDLFDNCGSDAAKKVFEKYLKDIHIKDTNCTEGDGFSPKNNSIEFNLHNDMYPDAEDKDDKKSVFRKHEVLLHECFHAIEHNFEKQTGVSTKTMYQTIKQEDGTEKRVYLADIMRQDALKYIEKRKSEMQEKFDSIIAESKDRGELLDKLKEGFFCHDFDEWLYLKYDSKDENVVFSDRLVRNAISKELKEMNKMGKCGVLSDMIESVTAFDCVGMVHGYAGHSELKLTFDDSGKCTDMDYARENTGYWDDGSIPEEATANMFSTLITNKDEFNRVKEVFPNAVKFFGKILKSMVD